MNNIHDLNGMEPIKQSENNTDDTDEMNEGSDELSEEGDENENGNEDGEDGDGDEDEDVGEETSTDFWQSLIEYFGICEGSKKVFRITVLPRIANINYLPIKANGWKTPLNTKM